MIRSYLKEILEVARQGDAREESYYPTLKELIENFASSINKENIHITILPKKTDAGNPDFRVWEGKQRIVGYIEAKTPETNLNNSEKTEQIKRYKNIFQNFILTNFLEFRLYRNNVLIDKVSIADSLPTDSRRRKIFAENEDEFKSLNEKFFSFTFPSITKSENLAIELAKRTRFLKDEVIAIELEEEDKNGIGTILGFYEAFQTYLIRGLTKEEFADLYSQTITYGLFISRMRCEGEFSRRLAIYDIPRNIGILRDIFDFISLGDLPSQLEWIVDEICDVLVNVDDEIFSHYENGEDPIHYFYETFLAEYNPEEREKRGVYYTPEQVVSYIVRSLDIILRDKFGLAEGLANDNLTILDPAGGTLTFLAHAIKKSVKDFIDRYGEGGKIDFIKEHILKNFYAFELMVAPYTIGHIKISYLLDELGYKLQEDERIKYYITNTLELEEIEQTKLPGMASLAEESRKAGEIKKNIPIFLIMGNPPYSGVSANMGDWITGLIEDYKYVDGKHFGERKHWLQDDYVKFIRFAEWKINQIGKGVVGYITNHSYLDNPTFRGMRQHLMKTFDEIYILDLHGNSLKKEKCPDGSKDENVFDIRRGVSISFFIKNKTDHNEDLKIYHSDIWGLREKKYKWLLSNDINTTEWQQINPHSKFYFFLPKEEKFKEIYEKFWKLTDIYPINVTGIVTSRDKFVIDIDKNILHNRIETFVDKELSDEYVQDLFNLSENYMWRVEKARKELISDRNWENNFTRILYRPFDVREIFYHKSVVWRTREKVMKHLLKPNIALLSMRQVSLDKPYTHAFVSENIVDNRLFLSSKGIVQIFPLFTYKNNEKSSNAIHQIFALMKETYGKNVDDEELFHYIYAILSSSFYREKYEGFIKIDFPRIPFTKDYELFLNMGKLGKKLVDLHLMKSMELDDTITKFQGQGDNIVIKPIYDEDEKIVYINKNQYFDEIDKDVWEYHIGGYQVLNKWLKDRRRKRLSLDEIKHYCKIVTVIKKTVEIQEDIDEIYPDVEDDTIEVIEDNKLDNFFK